MPYPLRLYIAQTNFVRQTLIRYRDSLINLNSELNLGPNLQSSTSKAETPEIRVPVGAMLAERRALKQAREKVRIQGEAILLQRKLLQSREELIKVQANRIAELENMIGLRTSAVPMLMNEPFMLNLDNKVS